MDPRLHRAEWRGCDLGDLLERELLEEMQHEHLALRQRQTFERREEGGLILHAQHLVQRIVVDAEFQFIGFIQWFRQKFPAAPVLGAFLSGDAEQPRRELPIFAQPADVSGGGDERFLHDIQCRGPVPQQLGNEHVERSLMFPEQSVPRVGVARARRGHGPCRFVSHSVW